MRTAKELMTTSVPKARSDETAGFALEGLREQKLEEASHLYLVDEVSVLTGQVPIERLIAAAPETPLGDLRGDPPIEVRPDDDAEMVALLAAERHDADVAVVVALTILCSSIIATLIASLLPWILDRMGFDPAMASGPVATVLQDLLSVAIYLGIATAII